MNLKELSNKKRYDILFTDIDGTLIDGTNDQDGKTISTFEQDLEKHRKLSDFYNSILKGNNIMVVVTSTFHNDSRKKLKNIDKVIDEKNKKKVLYFMSDKDRGTPEFINIDKLIYKGIEITLVKNKKEAVDKVLNYLKESNVEIGTIYGMGDSIADVDMLLRIKELGGITGLVADENIFGRYTPGYVVPSKITHENIEEVANNIAETEFRFERHNLINKYRSLYGVEFIKYIRTSDEFKTLKKKQESRALEIQEKFLCGALIRDDLVGLVYLSSLAFQYIMRNSNYEGNGIFYYDKDKYDEILKLGENVSTRVLERQSDLLLGRSIVKLFDNK